MFRPGLAVACLVLILSHHPACASHGRIRMPPRPCPDLSQILAFGRAQGTVVSDGRDGAFVAWADDRAISVQRLDPSGAIDAGWPAPGMTLGLISPGEEGYQSFVAADSAGGALVSWIGRQGEVRLQRVAGGCGITRGWPADGMILCDLPGTGRHPAVALTDPQSAMVVWREQETNGTQSIRLANVNLMGGLAEGWPANGLVLASGNDLASLSDLVPDGRGGAFVLWRRSGDAERSTTLVLQRILASGALGPGWAPEGLAVGQRLALGISFDDDREQPLLAADGRGGALVVWSTGRPVAREEYEEDVVAQRVGADGRNAPGWAAGGRTIAGDRGDQRLAAIAGGPHGTLIAWFDDAARDRVRVAQLDASGVVRDWGGVPATSVDRIAIGADGRGGAFVAWTTSDERAAAPRLLRWTAGGPGRDVETGDSPATSGWDTSRLALMTNGGGVLMVWSDWIKDPTAPRSVVRVSRERNGRTQRR